MKSKITILLVSVISIFLAQCKTFRSGTAAATTDKLYYNAVQDAATPTANKINKGLFAIDSSNNLIVSKLIGGENYIKVLSWKQNVWYYTSSANGYTTDRDIWVTAVPELKMKMASFKGDEHNRLKKYLGLPPTAAYDTFITFWVKPADLFRPCPDKEIWDNACSLTFPDSSDLAHIEWIKTARAQLIHNPDSLKRYPWTELGYTYDYSPYSKRHFGLSEYIIRKSATIYVDSVFTTKQYLNN